MQEMKKNKKRFPLMLRFVAMFLIFVVLALGMTGALSYVNQTRFYRADVEEQMRNVANYMNRLVESDSAAFLNMKEYILAHDGTPEQVQIPLDYDGDSTPAQAELQRLLSLYYPGMAEQDIPFAELTPDVQRAYATYYYELWLTMLEQSRSEFGLTYTYMVFPTSDGGDNMYFLYDGVREPSEADPSLMQIGAVYQQAREQHRYMWEAWENGTDPAGLDVMNNELGYVYTYTDPLVLNGETVALTCVEASVRSVNETIRDTTLMQSGLTLLVLAVCTVGMLVAIRSLVLRRIYHLEEEVGEYAREKNPALADSVERELEAEHYADEISNLTGQFAAMVRELETYMRNLESVTAERERIGAELDVATNIQASMLPNIFPPFPDREEFSLFASMDPAKEVGGDFYDFFFVDPDHLAVVIADVSGKGVPAALFMVIAKTLLKNHGQDGASPEMALFHTNNQLCEGNGGELFVTAWLGILDIRTGILSFSEAGHETPILLHADGTLEELKPKRKKPPLATLEGLKYLPNTIQLHKGDCLFLYTDGVPEATNAQEEMYGMERMEQFLRKHYADEPAALLHAVRQDVDQFVGDAPQFDDLTMLGLKILRIPEAAAEAVEPDKPA